MASPPRNEILDNIATLLATITTTNGYKTTVATVERVVKEWDAVGGSGVMPWLGFMAMVERKAYQPGGYIWCTIPIVVVGHLTCSSASDRTDKLADLEDDLTRAFHLDPTRGANAVTTTLIDCGTNEGDPDINSFKGGMATLQMTLEIQYQRTTSGS